MHEIVIDKGFSTNYQKSSMEGVSVQIQFFTWCFLKSSLFQFQFIRYNDDGFLLFQEPFLCSQSLEFGLTFSFFFCVYFLIFYF